MARVLVVEDDVQTAAEIAAALGDSGFDVDCAHTGREGLLKAGADTYEAIVLDRMLPWRGGRAYRSIDAPHGRRRSAGSHP